jgi:hypothetical protein
MRDDSFNIARGDVKAERNTNIRAIACFKRILMRVVRFRAKNFYERCLEYCRALRGASIYLHIFSIFLMVSGISGFIRPSDLNIRSM